jgi:hypothetical protein
VLLLLCLALYATLFSGRTSSAIWIPWTLRVPWQARSPISQHQDLHLDEAQCAASFPGLTSGIAETVGQGPFKMRMFKQGNGPLQIQIKDNQVHQSM